MSTCAGSQPVSHVVSQLRQDEPVENIAVPIRSGRFFKLANYWFFATREGPAMGPYDALEQAEVAVGDYVKFVSAASPRVLNLFTKSARPNL